MRTKDYIQENKGSFKHLEEIERVLEELRPIRNRKGGTDNEIGTTDYYRSYLTPESKGYKSDKLYEYVEIKSEIAVSFRQELLRVVREDKSFGYIYFLLQSAENNLTTYDIECRPDKIAINEAIDFCWEDLVEHLETLKTISEKILYIEDKKTLWEQDDNYKNLNRNITTFGEKCHAEILKLERAMQFNQKEVNPDKTKHEFPYRLSSKYDAQKVYDTFFSGEILLCNNDQFKDWLVDGYKTKKIKPILKGKISPKTGKESIAYGQIRKFIETITETDEIKDSYFVNVFGLPKDSRTGKNLDLKTIEKLETCKKQEEIKNK